VFQRFVHVFQVGVHFFQLAYPFVDFPIPAVEFPADQPDDDCDDNDDEDFFAHDAFLLQDGEVRDKVIIHHPVLDGNKKDFFLSLPVT
jgi:hypothetical protein